MLIGEIFIRNNLISFKELQSILNKQQKNKKKLGEILLDSGLISAQDLEKALQEQYWRKHGYWIIDAIDKHIEPMQE